MVVKHDGELEETEAAHFDHVHGGEVFYVCDPEDVWLNGEALKGGETKRGGNLPPIKSFVFVASNAIIHSNTHNIHNQIL